MSLIDFAGIGQFETVQQSRQRSVAKFGSYVSDYFAKRQEEERKRKEEETARRAMSARRFQASTSQFMENLNKRFAPANRAEVISRQAPPEAHQSFQDYAQNYMNRHDPAGLFKQAPTETQRVGPGWGGVKRALGTALEIADYPYQKAIRPVAEKAIVGKSYLPMLPGVTRQGAMTKPYMELSETEAEQVLGRTVEQAIPGWGLTKLPKIGRGATKAGTFSEFAAKYTDDLVKAAPKVARSQEEISLLSQIERNEGLGVRQGVESFWDNGIPTIEAHRTSVDASIRLGGLSDDEIKSLREMQQRGNFRVTEGPKFGNEKWITVDVPGGTEDEIADSFGWIAEQISKKAAPKITKEVPPLSSLDSAIDKLKEAAKIQRENIAKLKPLRAQERAAQAARGEAVFQKALAEGKEYGEAYSLMRGAQARPLTKALAPGIEWTDEEFTGMTRAIEEFDFGRGLKPDFTRDRARGAFLKLVNHEAIQENEIVTLERIYGNDFGDAIRKLAEKSETEGHAVWRVAQDVWLLPKAFRSAFDVSNPLRQSIILAPSHPKEWLSSLKPMFRAFANEEYAQASYRGLLSDPEKIRVTFKGPKRTTHRAVSFGKIIEDTEMLLDPHLTMAAADPKYIGKLAERIPILGKVVRMSNRAFVTFSNEVRGRTVKTVVKALAKDHPEAITPEYLQGLANYLQRAGGIGTLPRGSVTTVLRLMEWSPFYRISSVQALATLGNVRQPYVAKQAARDIALYFGTGVSLLAAAKYSGAADAEINPLSTDFGKITIGNTHVNIWGTGQVLARTVARAIMGATKTEGGDIVPMRRQKVIGQYLQSGFSPEISLAYDIWQGENYGGYPVKADKATLKREFIERTLPLSMLDVFEAVKEYGFLGAAIAPYTALGGSVSTYEPSASIQIAQRSEELTGETFNPETDYTIVRSNPELKALWEKGRREGWERGRGKTSQELEQTRTLAEQNLQLPMKAQGVLKGDKAAGPEFVDAWTKYTDQMVGAYRLAYINQEPRAAETPKGKALDAYYNLDPNDYPDETGYGTDWGAFDKVKDAAFAQLPLDLRNALDMEMKSLDPTVQQAEAQYKKAKDLRGELYDRGKYNGLNGEQSQTVDKFRAQVTDIRRQIMERDRREYAMADVAKWLAKQQGEPVLYQWFIAIQKDYDKALSPQYTAFLTKHRPELEIFYPNLYSTGYLKRAGIVPEETSPWGTFSNTFPAWQR